MSTKQLQNFFDNHTAFRDRGPSFRVFASVLFLFHLLAIVFVWLSHLWD